MKIHRFALIAALLSGTAFAQTNTYPFPASGSVGIGTTSPGAYKLNVSNPTGYGILSTAGYSDTIGGRRNFTLNAGSGDWWAFGVSNDGGFALDFLDPNGGGATPFNSFAVKSTGNVGIGITNPQAKLEIGAVGANSPSLIIGKNNFVGFRRSDGIVVYGVGHDATDDVFRIGASPALSPGAGTDIDINSGGYRISLSQGGVERMRVDTGGNIGIGTTTPTTMLEVAANKTSAPLAVFRNTGGGTNNGISLSTDNTANSSARNWGIAFNSYAYGDFVIRQSNTLGGDPFASGTERLLIDFAGNVGIGTTTPIHKLAVNGTIKAKEVIVETTGWSDYVFADDYTLQPLSEVEAHIKTAKHLPGIPSAAQIAEQGVSIGDMQARLLAKIEEITLHQIAQEKLLKAQAEELTALRAELRASRLRN